MPCEQIFQLCSGTTFHMAVLTALDEVRHAWMTFWGEENSMCSQGKKLELRQSKLLDSPPLDGHPNDFAVRKDDFEIHPALEEFIDSAVLAGSGWHRVRGSLSIRAHRSPDTAVRQRGRRGLLRWRWRRRGSYFLHPCAETRKQTFNTQVIASPLTISLVNAALRSKFKKK